MSKKETVEIERKMTKYQLAKDYVETIYKMGGHDRLEDALASLERIYFDINPR